MMQKTTWFILAMSAMAASFSLALVHRERKIVILTQALPSLYVGEKVTETELIDPQGKAIRPLSRGGPHTTLFFLFEQPCTPCNRNLRVWNKISSLAHGKVQAYGIVLSSLEEAANFSMEQNPAFPVCVPSDIQRFRQRYRLRYGFAQTILFQGDTVRNVYLGDLSQPVLAALLKDISRQTKEKH